MSLKNNVYRLEIDRLKNNRFKILAEFYRQLRQIEDVLKKYRGIGTDFGITFDEIDKLDLNISQNVTDKVVFKKIYSEGNRIILDVIMLKGGELALHWHPDCSEKIEIEEGILYDKETDESICENTEKYYLENVKHDLVALKNTILTVTFYKIK